VTTASACDVWPRCPRWSLLTHRSAPPSSNSANTSPHEHITALSCGGSWHEVKLAGSHWKGLNVQERTVTAENLPKDHTVESLTALFSAVGTVKTLRVCDAAEAQTSKQVRCAAPRAELNGGLLRGAAARTVVGFSKTDHHRIALGPHLLRYTASIRLVEETCCCVLVSQVDSTRDDASQAAPT
jgi:hypothetical protein